MALTHYTSLSPCLSCCSYTALLSYTIHLIFNCSDGTSQYQCVYDLQGCTGYPVCLFILRRRTSSNFRGVLFYLDYSECALVAGRQNKPVLSHPSFPGIRWPAFIAEVYLPRLILLLTHLQKMGYRRTLSTMLGKRMHLFTENGSRFLYAASAYKLAS